MTKTNSEYIAWRLTAERNAAPKSKNKAAKAAHEALANEYESRLNRARPQVD
jgi:hypothetical protein